MNILDLLQSAGILPKGQGQTSPAAPIDPGMSMPQALPDPGPQASPDIVVQGANETREVPEDSRSQPAQSKMTELVRRKGLFGIHGTLRDVLGLVGDGLLVGSGKQAIYSPARHEEKVGSAIYGYNNDPQAAIDRAALVDPATAIDLQKQYGLDKRYDQAAKAQVISGQQKAAQVLGAWAGAIKSPEQYALAKDKMKAYAQANGVSDQYDFPDQYDENGLAQIMAQGINPDNQLDNARQDQNTRSQMTSREEAIQVARQRASDAREAAAARTSVARQNAGTAASRAAESARHNRISETQGQARIDKPSGGNRKPTLAERFNLPAPPPGFKLK